MQEFNNTAINESANTDCIFFNECYLQLRNNGYCFSKCKDFIHSHTRQKVIRRVITTINDLDEAIKHCNEVAERLEGKNGYAYTDVTCEECTKEHRQLAEWLRELKAYKEARKEITRKMNSGQWSEGVVYGLDKAVRIMEKHLREVNVDDGDSN